MEIKVRIYKDDGSGGYRYNLVKKYNGLIWAPDIQDYYGFLNQDNQKDELVVFTEYDIVGPPVTGCNLLEVPFEEQNLISAQLRKGLKNV